MPKIVEATLAPSRKWKGRSRPERRFSDSRNLTAEESKLNLVTDLGRATREDWKISSPVANQTKIEWAVNKFYPSRSPEKDEIFPALITKGTASLERN